MSENPFFQGVSDDLFRRRTATRRVAGGAIPARRLDRVSLICLLAVAIRASVMALLPSILHPDESDVARGGEPARQSPRAGDVGLSGRRTKLAMARTDGRFHGLRRVARVAAVRRPRRRAVLICILSLAPVICGFLWGRNVAGFAGAVMTGLLNAVWFELVYFYTHPLSESFAGTVLVTGLFLVYPGRNIPVRTTNVYRRCDVGPRGGSASAACPCDRVAVLAVGGIRRRAHYPGLLGGLALSIGLSGLLDWITWGWPFHSTIIYVYYRQSGLGGRPQPGLLLHRLAMGFLGPLWRCDRALRALWRDRGCPSCSGWPRPSSLSIRASVTKNIGICRRPSRSS